MQCIDFSVSSDVLKVDINRDFSGLHNIKNFIRNSFEEYYFGRKEIILYEDPNGTQQHLSYRKQLIEMLLLHGNGEKSGDRCSKEMQFYQKKIHIAFNSHKPPVQRVAIKMEKSLYRNYKLTFTNDTIDIIYNFFKSRLSDYVVHDEKGGVLNLYISDNDAASTLLLICEKEMVMGKQIVVDLDEMALHELYKLSSEKKEKELSLSLRHSYKLLGLSSDITDIKRVKKQYYKLAKDYHPDQFYAEESCDIEYKSKRFVKIKEAFDEIKSHILFTNYDNNDIIY